MDSGYMALSIYFAHMSSKWSCILDSQPIQGKDMSVHVYYHHFCNWKKKLEDVNYIVDEGSYIDDFLRGMKMDLAVRVWEYKGRICTLYDAFRRAEIEETTILWRELSKKNDVDKVFDEMLQPVLVSLQSDASLFEDEENDYIPSKIVGLQSNEDSLINKAEFQLIHEIEQPQLKRMGSVKTEHQLFDKIPEPSLAEHNNGIGSHEAVNIGFLDSNGVKRELWFGKRLLFAFDPGGSCVFYKSREDDATEVSLIIISWKPWCEEVAAFVEVEKYEMNNPHIRLVSKLDTGFWLGKMSMFIFDPGGSSLYHMRCHSFKSGSCSLIDEQFNTFLKGKPDTNYDKLRWMPNGCSLPRLDKSHILEFLRGKRLVSVNIAEIQGTENFMNYQSNDVLDARGLIATNKESIGEQHSEGVYPTDFLLRVFSSNRGAKFDEYEDNNGLFLFDPGGKSVQHLKGIVQPFTSQTEHQGEVNFVLAKDGTVRQRNDEAVQPHSLKLSSLTKLAASEPYTQGIDSGYKQYQFYLVNPCSCSSKIMIQLAKRECENSTPFIREEVKFSFDPGGSSCLLRTWDWNALLENSEMHQGQNMMKTSGIIYIEVDQYNQVGDLSCTGTDILEFVGLFGKLQMTCKYIQGFLTYTSLLHNNVQKCPPLVKVYENIKHGDSFTTAASNDLKQVLPFRFFDTGFHEYMFAPLLLLIFGIWAHHVAMVVCKDSNISSVRPKELNAGALYTLDSVMGISVKPAFFTTVDEINSIANTALGGAKLKLILLHTKCIGFLGKVGALQLIELIVVKLNQKFHGLFIIEESGRLLKQNECRKFGPTDHLFLELTSVKDCIILEQVRNEVLTRIIKVGFILMSYLDGLCGMICIK